MKWNKYLKMSEKTLSTEFFIDEKLQRVLHGVIGLSTEIEELLDNYEGDDSMDDLNMLEEIGDLTWYLAILYREYPEIGKINIKYKGNEDGFKCVLNLNKTVLKLLDILKKKIYYNKPINDEMFNTFVKIIDFDIKHLCKLYNLDIEEVCRININKLKARYGDKFSSDRAINRDIDNEINILKNN